MIYQHFHALHHVTSNDFGGSPLKARSHIVRYALSNSRTRRVVSNSRSGASGLSSRRRSNFNSSGWAISARAREKYSSSELVTNSGKSQSNTQLAPTLPAKLFPRHVSSGTPARSASEAVVWL